MDFFLNDSKLSDFLIFQSNLFHSIIVEGKHVFLKNRVSHLLLEFYYFALFSMTYCVQK